VMIALNRGEPMGERMIRKICGIPVPRIREILAEMSGRGLVVLHDRGGRFQAGVAPDTPWSYAVGNLLREAEVFIRKHGGGMNPRHRCMS